MRGQFLLLGGQAREPARPPPGPCGSRPAPIRRGGSLGGEMGDFGLDAADLAHARGGTRLADGHAGLHHLGPLRWTSSAAYS